MRVSSTAREENQKNYNYRDSMNDYDSEEKYVIKWQRKFIEDVYILNKLDLCSCCMDKINQYNQKLIDLESKERNERTEFKRNRKEVHDAIFARWDKIYDQ